MSSHSQLQWGSFREYLLKANTIDELLGMFERNLRDQVLEACNEQLTHATLVSVPKQRNSRK